MGQPKAVEAAGLSGYMRVEHVKARGMVRLVVGEEGSTRETILEVDVGEFLDRLGLMSWPAPEPAAFLVFAGNTDRTVGGAGDFVGAFPTEGAARQAFGSVCQEFSPDWAQLVRVEQGGRLSVVCWRGASGGHRPMADLRRPDGENDPTEAAAAVVVALPRRSLLGRWSGRAADGSE